MDSGDSGNQYCMTKHGSSYPQIVYWLRVSGVWNYPIRWAYIKFSPSFFLDDNVLIVIGGDSYYRDENEEVRFVISRWARKKVASQFSEEYLDGWQSFIFSWHKKHLDPWSWQKRIQVWIHTSQALAKAHTACDPASPVEAENTCDHLCRQECEARGKSYSLHPLFLETYWKITVLSPGLIQFGKEYWVGL